MNKHKKYFRKILTINAKIFPYLVFLTFFFLFIESYMYEGFLAKILFVNARTFLFLTLCSSVGAFMYRVSEKKEDYTTTLVININQLMLPIFIASYVIMQYSEVLHFSNYVYSTYHFGPANFFYVLIFSAVLCSIDLVTRSASFKIFISRIKQSGKYRSNSAIYFLGFITLLCLSIFTIKNLTKTLSYITYQDLYIFNHINDTYQEKMRRAWGFYFDYMEFVKQYATGTNITILAPPQESPWLTSGNAGLDRYFLYPAKVVSATNDLSQGKDYDYIMISRGEWAVADETRYGWPKNKIKAERVWYIDENTKKITEYIGDYNPDNFAKKGVWGLIKIKK